MTAADFLIYGGIGMLSGFFAGLLGLGGGAIVASMLIVIFSARPEFPESVAARMAIGTTLAIVACTSAPSAAAHARRGGVDWSVARTMTLGAMLGAVLRRALNGARAVVFLKGAAGIVSLPHRGANASPPPPDFAGGGRHRRRKVVWRFTGHWRTFRDAGDWRRRFNGSIFNAPRNAHPFCDWNFGVSRLPPVAVGGAGFHFGRTGRRRFGCSPFMGLCLLAGAVWSCGVQRVLGAAGRGGDRQTPRNHPTPNLRRNEPNPGPPPRRLPILTSRHPQAPPPPTRIP